MPQFCTFAASLLESKISAGDLSSQATKDLWLDVLENHLYEAPFAARFVEQIRTADILGWKESIRIGTKSGQLSPHTANVWIRILRVIVKAFVQRYELDRDPMQAVPLFDTSRWRGKISKEQPNSLTAGELRMFLRLCRKFEPEHFAMTALGFALGARPSSLRPLRRGGPSRDYDPETGELILRRSQTRGKVAMESTKNGEDVTMILPPTLREIIAWHVATFLVPRNVKGAYRPCLGAERRAASDLLFPSRTGRYLSTTSLWKPFTNVCARMKEETGGSNSSRR
jgi:integrase